MKKTLAIGKDMIEEKQYKSPIEKLLKKNFEEMATLEFIKIKIISSLIFGLLFASIISISGDINSFKSYIIFTVFLSLGWYFLFWIAFCKKRKL